MQASPFKPFAFVDAWNIHDPMVRRPARVRACACMGASAGVCARSDARRLPFPSGSVGVDRHAPRVAAEHACLPQAQGHIEASDFEPFLTTLGAPLGFRTTECKSAKLRRLLSSQIPVQASLFVRAWAWATACTRRRRHVPPGIARCNAARALLAAINNCSPTVGSGTSTSFTTC